MKKLLALVLALVMVMSLCITSNAAFTDAEDVNYDEAVDVMSMVGVLKGYEDGSFQPAKTVTRAEAAKIIAYLDLGNKAADALTKDVTAFSDVAAGNWAAGYITYCYNAGIIAGVGDGKFAPDAQVTALQFAKMLLVVLGYNAEAEGMVGGDWALATAKLAAKKDLFKGNSNLSVNDPATREEAALYAFNALNAKTVTAGSGNVTVKGQGMEVTVGGSAATDNSTALKDELYKKSNGDPALVKSSLTVDTDSRRPGYTWTYYGKTNETVFVGQEPVATFTANVKESAVKSALKGYTVSATEDYNGADTNYSKASFADIAASTLNGRLVECYDTDDNKVIDSIVTIDYSVGKVTKVSTDKKTGDVTYYVDNASKGVVYADDTDDTIVLNGTFAKDDYVTYVTLNGTTYLYPTTKVTGSVSSVSSTSKVTIDGTTYEMKYGVGAPSASSDEYNFYLDQYGFIAASDSAAVASTNYVKIVDVEGKVGGSFGEPTLKVRAVLADGTVGVYNVAIKKVSGAYQLAGLGTALTTNSTDDALASSAGIDNKVFGYTLKDDVLTLEALTQAEATITAESAVRTATVASVTSSGNKYTFGTNNTVLFNSSTVFVNYNSTKHTATVYTGFANMEKLTTGASAIVIAKSGTGSSVTTCAANVVFFEDAGFVAKTIKEYVYIDASKYIDALDEDGEAIKQYTGIFADGTEKVLTAGENALSGKHLYSFDAKDVVDGTNDLLDSSAPYLKTGKMAVSGDMVSDGTNWYYMTDDTIVNYIDSDLDEIGGNYGFIVLEKADSTNIAAIFVVSATSF